MGTDPANTYTRDQITEWLEGIAAGSLDLAVDNATMAAAALAALSAPPAPQPIPQPQPSPLPAGNLTEHFTLAELTYSDTANSMGIDNTPDADGVEELTKTAELLEKIRDLCGGNPVFVSSGFRCPAVNSAVGGASNSAHVWGGAADFTIPAFGSVLDVCHAIEPHLGAWGVDQLIDESGGGAAWVHIGRAPDGYEPRAQCLTINPRGTTTGIA
jgi:zinc D-Ala-D-Ala carboxypeptidase